MNNEIKTPGYVVSLAREMRLNPTASEKKLWDKLKSRQLDGYKFRFQHPVYRYILDFYCSEKHLAIEIDGDIHKSRRDYDEYRDEYFLNIGIRTLRFTNDDVLTRIDFVLKEIGESLKV